VVRAQIPGHLSEDGYRHTQATPTAEPEPGHALKLVRARRGAQPEKDATECGWTTRSHGIVLGICALSCQGQSPSAAFP
jgi:hypothetical protein